MNPDKITLYLLRHLTLAAQGEMYKNNISEGKILGCPNAATAAKLEREGLIQFADDGSGKREWSLLTDKGLEFMRNLSRTYRGVLQTVQTYDKGNQ